MRRSDFQPGELYGIVERLAKAGLDDSQIAKRIGVHPNTFYKWKRDGDVAGALKAGRTEAVLAVQSTLLQRALGYETEAVKTTTRTFVNAAGRTCETRRSVRVCRKVPPSVHAIRVFLACFASDSA